MRVKKGTFSSIKYLVIWQIILRENHIEFEKIDGITKIKWLKNM